jgi:hypothetical protein
MIPAKQILLVTTFLLGSCVPIQPQPITIYNTIETGQNKDVRVIKCQNGGTYSMPDMVTLDDIDDGDDRGVVDRLNEHIAFLRGELRELALRGGCRK